MTFCLTTGLDSTDLRYFACRASRQPPLRSRGGIQSPAETLRWCLKSVSRTALG
jgi:hypothetical protein